jgi:16S rRNA (cytosine967-C5)-methyltransferase
MKHGGIISAAIEVLADIEARHRPTTEALRDWGVAHRFAGSGDRAVLGNLVFDALRCRASIAWRMGTDSPRALAIGAYGFLWAGNPEQVEAIFSGDRHAPEPLTDAEKVALRSASLDDAPPHVAGDYPEWLHGALERVFGEQAAAEGRALAMRAPVDLRVNSLKSTRDRVLAGLSDFAAQPTPFSDCGVRVPVGDGPARAPNVISEPGYRKGWFEVQDEGSQLAALLSCVRPAMQVADICAGAGGKTLAMAAAMSRTPRAAASRDR